ncbi:MAG TPA: NAD(P)/FAD-dependent oxidoreductase [Polyangiaceae bacterium]|jgi:monoamine oxidase|nr:NAD(P)/FAD-dependent oxidoreductase [Polyangiaceae bacterium]
MARTPLFSRLLDTMFVARSSRPAEEAVERAHAHRVSRRQALAMGAATVGGASLLAGCAADTEAAPNDLGRAAASAKQIATDVGVVGAGIAGLACAYELKKAGVSATLHDAASRVGGRIWSMGGAFAGPVMFPGQVVERGGELIDTPHKTMIGYARELGLTLEDITKPARETKFFFDGGLVSEATMVEQYRVLVDAMRDDLRKVGFPTADAFTADDAALDNLSLREYLDSRGAPPQIKKLLNVAYEIEYGVATDAQSCLSFLLFAKASRQSKLRLWGNFSDERYHVVGGNQQITEGLAARLPGQIRLGRRLVGVRKASDGRVVLTFKEGNKTVTATHDAVVLALPFNILRDVALDASLGLPASKIYAIQNTVYGTNAKLMVGFTGRPWLPGSGAAYSDLPYLQTTWETSPSTADATRGVITDYTGGALGSSLSAATTQADTARFLGNFDMAYPGASASARRTSGGAYVAHLQHWPSDPNTKGSYTANAPGYFTRIEGNEAKAVGNLFFAGETTDSFYSWQGFMEGGALSGLRAAGEIQRAFR